MNAVVLTRWLTLCLPGMACAFGVLRAAPNITVHLVPHTHDDTGWLKTVDQYHSGSNNTIQHANVGRLISSVVDALSRNPERTFVYAEIAFFQRWWRVQSSETQALTRKLVRNGQLSFVNGGWCMHDEASPHYLDMIDQTTLGHALLLEELDTFPTVGWQLDPFGHSATQAALLSAEVGFDGLFFGRLDYQDLAKRKKDKAAEWVWRASPSLGPDAQVFTGLTGSYGGNYGPPGGFCWDIKCSDEPMQDDESLDTYNIPSRVAQFVAAARSQANETRGSHILFTMGSDYQYEDAEEWFVNLDKLVKYVNAASATTGVRAQYSSMDTYVAAKRAEPKTITWPLKTDDMFPYADGPHMFWSGFFTSRPALKRYVRTSSAQLQSFRHLLALAKMSPPVGGDAPLLPLQEALGVVQHHDAVTGTEMQHVAFDYAARLHKGVAHAAPSVSTAIATLAAGGQWEQCALLNVSVCAPTQGIARRDGAVRVAVYNPLAQTLSTVLSLPVNQAQGLTLTDSKGAKVTTTVVEAPHPVTNYEPDNRAVAAPYAMYFAAELPPLSLTTYTLTSAKDVAHVAATPPTRAEVAATPSSDGVRPDAAVTLSNGHITLSFDGATGALISMKNDESGVSTPLTLTPLSYKPHVKKKSGHGSDQPSGAYIFRPNASASLAAGAAPIHFEYKPADGQSKAVQYVRQSWAPWLNISIYLKDGARHAEVVVTAGALPLATELIVRFASHVQSNGTMYTDANGREMLERKKNFRPSWTLNQTEQQAGNYFPITTGAYVRDATRQLTVLTDASCGAASLADGELEMMLHRRLEQDDSRGVGEPLNETEHITPYTFRSSNEPIPAAESIASGSAADSGLVAPLTDGNGIGLGRSGGQHRGRGLIVRATYKVALDPPATAAATWRPLMDATYTPPQLFFSAAGTRVLEPPHALAAGALVKPLPPNLQIITLELRNATSALLRLSNQFGLHEDASLSKPVSVDLATLFTPSVLHVVHATELSLTANRPKAALLARREENARWPVDGETRGPPKAHEWRAAPPLQWESSTVVTLGPLEIKTFLLTLN